MVSAGNYKQNRSVAIIGTLHEGLVNQLCREVFFLSTNHAIAGEPCEKICGRKEIAYLQQPNDLGAGLAAPECHDVTTNRFV